VPGEAAVFRERHCHHADVPGAASGLTHAGPGGGRLNRSRPAAALLSLLFLLLLLAACGASSQANGQTTLDSSTNSGPVDLRLGYFANITHAPALVGVSKGYFKGALASNVNLTTQTFAAGPAEVEAIFGGGLDAGFIGPSPAVNAYIRSKGAAIRIVSGAASGGASLVVRPAAGINGPSDLKGRTLATPQLGNTQDVALRAYLLDHGIHTDAEGGGDAKIVPSDNATTLQLFQQGKVDGAWVPEPWAARLHLEAGGKVLVDERTLWSGGQFATTELIVAKDFLYRHPDTVKALITGEVKAVDWISNNPTEAKAAVNDAILQLTTRALKPAVIDEAWPGLSFGVDPLASTLKKEAADAKRTGLLTDTNLSNILDLRLLNEVLAAGGKPKVGTAGLGSG
jgi:NitT/TauT family transport system substrate-binding protein